MLGAWLRQRLGTLQEKKTHGWRNTRTLKCTISKVTTSAWGPPLGEADDKCINLVITLYELSHSSV